MQVHVGIDNSIVLLNGICSSCSTVLPIYSFIRSILVNNLAVSTDSACGGDKPLIIEASSEGYIQSPNYPNNYPNRADCSWAIKVSNGTRMTIRIEDVEVENGYSEIRKK